MQYVGGKSRIAKEIAEIIGGGYSFVSLFCGGLSVELAVQGFEKKLLNDKNSYLISMYKALQNGWIPPDTITKDDWWYVKAHVNENPPLSAFVGFGCSYGGKWFSSPYLTRHKHDSVAEKTRNLLLKDFATLDNAEFVCGDYKDLEIPEYSTIYCDPPYKDCVIYPGAEDFDIDEFWDYARELAANGHKVFISEYAAPDDVPCIWQKEMRCRFGGANNRMSVEKLFYLGN